MSVCHDARKPFQTYRKLLEQALAFRPHVAVLMFGTNDSKRDQWRGLCDQLYVPDYIDLIRRFQRLNTTVYIMTPPPVYAPFLYMVDPKQVDALGELTAHIARVTGLAPPIDLYNPLGGMAKTGAHLFCDGVHPGNAGYEVIADTVHKALTEYNREVRELEPESLRLKRARELASLQHALASAVRLLEKRKPKRGHAWTLHAKRTQAEVIRLKRARASLLAEIARAEQAGGEAAVVEAQPAEDLQQVASQ